MADEDKKAADKAAADAKAAEQKAAEAKVAEPSPVVLPPVPQLDIAQAQLIAQVAAQVAAQMHANAGKPAARAENSDKTVPGGKYVIDGVTLNAWGEPYVEGQDATHGNPERRGF